MREYVKLHTTLKDRILFLFTGLIKKNLIISNTVNHKVIVSDKDEVVIQSDDGEPIDKIPFFELDNSDTKSNL